MQLPLLRNGDWLCFPNAGAYTVAAACDFNGIAATQPKLFYVYSEHAVDAVVDALDTTQGCEDGCPATPEGSEDVDAADPCAWEATEVQL